MRGKRQAVVQTEINNTDKDCTEGVQVLVCSWEGKRGEEVPWEEGREGGRGEGSSKGNTS